MMKNKPRCGSEGESIPKKHFLPDGLLRLIFIYAQFKVVSLNKNLSKKHFD